MTTAETVRVAYEIRSRSGYPLARTESWSDALDLAALYGDQGPVDVVTMHLIPGDGWISA